MNLRITSIMHLRLRTSPKFAKPLASSPNDTIYRTLRKRAGIERSSLYRAFAGSPKHPNFKTVLSVLDAMGFQLHVTARRGERARTVHLVRSSKLPET